MALLSTEEDQSFDESVKKSSLALSRVSVNKFVDFQNLFSRALIFQRYRRNSKEYKSVYIIIAVAFLFSLLLGMLMMTDVFGLYPQIMGMTDYLKALTKVNFHSIACFSALKQLSLNRNAVFNNTDVLTYAYACPKLLVDDRIDLAKVTSPERLRHGRDHQPLFRNLPKHKLHRPLL